MNVGIVGCGLIGAKRAASLDGHRLVCVTDLQAGRAQALAGGHGARVVADWRAMMAQADVDAVIVAVTHNQLAQITLAAVETGKHVLAEKPGALHAGELGAIVAASRRNGRTVRIGFNHRFHPALQKARELIAGGQPGPLMFIRGRYGHGGRIGYEKEWRADEAVSGGGEAIDQGVHLVDLSRWFLGDFTEVSGCAPTFFWDMRVEDNAFFQLRTAAGQVAWLHASWTEWKNMFSLEIYGRHAKLQIDGLGGSYGPEKLTYYKMLPQLGPPETTVFEFPGGDASWKLEFDHFVRAIEGRPSDGCTVEDAMAALDIAQRIRRNR